MRAILGAAASTLLIAAPAFGQEVEDNPETKPESEVPTETPIVVSGEKEGRKGVYAGSRIPKRARINTDVIASSTGTPGLGPQSGMDPAASVRTIRKRGCVSDDPAIGKKAACVLADAMAAREAKDMETARDLFAYVTLSEEFTPVEQLAGAKWQYRLAQEEGNDASREAALEQMMQTGAMDEAEQIKVQRALVSLALSDKNNVLARERLIVLDEMGGADARRLANLAILTRQLNESGAAAIMGRAIAMQTAEGLPSAQGWIDFAAAAD